MTAVPQHDPLVVVVGGANTDIVAFPSGPFLPHDSNPGHVRTSAGGVARNIAENLARIGVRVELVTVFGDDVSGRALAEECRAVGIGLAGSHVAADLPGARYVAVNDEHHDLAAAVSDMRCLEQLDAGLLAESPVAELLGTADFVVADANLGPEVLAWLAADVPAPLAVDPVSTAKALRVEPLLGRLAVTTPNAQEAGAMLGIDSPLGLASAEEAAHALVARGVGAAYVTLGGLGVAWADVGGGGVMGPPDVAVANTNGAGDAFMAGVVYAMLTGGGGHDGARMGGALAAIALVGEETVNPELGLEWALTIAEGTDA